jgi:hypothetical protein
MHFIQLIYLSQVAVLQNLQSYLPIVIIDQIHYILIQGTKVQHLKTGARAVKESAVSHMEKSLKIAKIFHLNQVITDKLLNLLALI